MPFTVEDFDDLLRLLEQRPEWRAELRRHVLTEDLLGLPGVVRELAEAQQRTERHLAELAAAQTRAAAALESLTGRVGKLAGEMLEWRYERRAGPYFSRLARKLRVVNTSALADMLDDAIHAGRLTDAEREAVLDADLVLGGPRREDGADVSLVVEISAGVGIADVTRASERAAVLAKIDRPAVLVVAGEWINPEAVAAAHAYGVWQVLDGRATPPTSASSSS
jgi:hypothetical protein